jgi:hypothetical protein
MKGKNQIIQAMEDTLKLKLGETSEQEIYSSGNQLSWLVP